MANLKAVISFGLVSIPVEIISASSPKDGMSFRQLDSKDHARIRYKRVNENTGKEVEWEDIVKGVEVEKGEYVIFDDNDLEALQAESNKNLEIDMFVDQAEISPIYFETPYYLAPGKGGEKAYTLLRTVLAESNKFAVVQAVLRNRQQLGVIFGHEDLLVFGIIRYADELKKPSKLAAELDLDAKVTDREVSMALRLVEDMTGEFKPEAYKDTYAEKLKAAIQAKLKGKKVVPLRGGKEPASKTTLDITELLKRSLKDKTGKATEKKQKSSKKQRAA